MTKSVALNEVVPDFTAQATSLLDIKLSLLKGYKVVLYFYPKDNTPGCTVEGQEFTKLYSEFKDNTTLVFGVSKDSLASHEKFKEKFDFPFQLISDEDESLCKLFDVIKMKNMYGREVLGIERSTFLINEEGVLKKEWRRLNVSGHAEEVLKAAKAL